MKLKAFDLYDIGLSSDKKLKEKIEPYIKYFVSGDSIAICLQENVKKIKMVIKDNGYDIENLEIMNLDKFYKTSEGWDYVYLGELEIDGDEVWKEFGKVLKEKEEELLNTDNYEELWFKYQRLALRNIFNKIVEKETEAFENRIKEAQDDFEKRIGVYERKQ